MTDLRDLKFILCLFTLCLTYIWLLLIRPVARNLSSYLNNCTTRQNIQTNSVGAPFSWLKCVISVRSVLHPLSSFGQSRSHSLPSSEFFETYKPGVFKRRVNVSHRQACHKLHRRFTILYDPNHINSQSPLYGTVPLLNNKKYVYF